MALKLRKDIKKSLYYVWFLGAKESKGLRGSEYIKPVIKHLEQREKEVEPFKVTLQVSHKGLKIIQNVVAQGKTKPKNETIKHFIPHNTITCVYQQEDIIACILLLFNPVTKCPLHIHAYRCDSVETAGLLKQQLQVLIESPENQKKFSEIEGRLNPPVKEVKKLESSLGSDTGTSTRESESSEERYHVDNIRVTTLYDSVAAELRAKLNKNNEPILLPPRDYDTVHRQKGNLTGIELRRCLNASIVGQNVKAKRLESSGGSSGIGSDHPPSPDSPNAPDSRFNTLDNHSTSDEEWNANTNESALYLMHTSSSQVTLPRPSRNPDREAPEEIHGEYRSEQHFGRYQEPMSPKLPKGEPRTRPDKYHHGEKSPEHEISKYLEKPIAKYTENKYLERQKSLERERQKTMDYHKTIERSEKSSERHNFSNGHKSLEKQNSRSRSYDYDASNKYYYETEKNGETGKNPERRYYDDDIRKAEKEDPTKYFEDDGFDESIRYRNSSNTETSRYSSYEPEEYHRQPPRIYQSPPVPKTRQKYIEEYAPGKKYDKQYIEDYQREPDMRVRNKKEEEEFRRESDVILRRKGEEDYRRDSEMKVRNKKEEEEYKREAEIRGRIKKSVEEYHKEPEVRGKIRNGQEEFTRESDLRPRTKKIIENHDEIDMRSKIKPSVYQKDHRYFGEEPRPRPKSVNEPERQRYSEFFDSNSNRRKAQFRQRSPSPEVIKASPQDRFRDAKEKFLSMERERLANQRRGNIEEPSQGHDNKAPFLKRHESMINPMKERYEDNYFDDRSEGMPKPSPRIAEEVRYRRESPVDRYRNADKMDPKRRSMFNLIEDEHRKNSNEIAREIKRRSYLETSNYEDEMYKERERERTYHELPESERYPNIERDYNYNKSTHDLDKVTDMKYDPKFVKNQKTKGGAGYRHSYAEPKLRVEKKNGYSEMLHRTNSSVGINGRVGIASVHPY